MFRKASKIIASLEIPIVCHLKGIAFVAILFVLVGAADFAMAGAKDPRNFFHGAPRPTAGAGLPILATGGGIYLLVRRLRRRPSQISVRRSQQICTCRLIASDRLQPSIAGRPEPGQESSTVESDRNCADRSQDHRSIAIPCGSRN